MSRLPIRVRLTLAFAIAMAIVFAATGAFVYFRVESALDEGIAEALEARLADATALARAGKTGRRADDEGFTTIVGGRSSAVPRDRVEGGMRISGAVVETDLGRRTVIVGASLADRDEALAEVLTQMAIAGPVALLLASLLGYWLSGAALRPVERMRVEAAAISGSEPGRRLPSGDARDEIARLSETLNAMLGRLERAIERERSFVADASHELRTPLALLQAELELALRKPRTGLELEEAIRSATAETERLVRLAEDLLVLAQADDGRLPLRREPVRAGELLGAVREAFRFRAEAEGRPIEADSADAIVLEADRLRLEQALGNLVDNALRHGAGAIRLDAVEQDGQVDLHVRDEGPGLAPEFLPHAFERFSRADAARTGGGAGLGLALASAIAEAHGGAAQAASGRADVWLSIPTR
ncbi:MAG TPA: ATP-binding protein [Gaiellaceae bacterium]|nr:ATP-binding protein [Gaiellaceae bacterium]